MLRAKQLSSRVVRTIKRTFCPSFEWTLSRPQIIKLMHIRVEGGIFWVLKFGQRNKISRPRCRDCFKSCGWRELEKIKPNRRSEVSYCRDE
jgi:hypothetical protein